MNIDTPCHIQNFRKFMIYSTCRNHMPIHLLEDPTVYPERTGGEGAMYVESKDKETLAQIGEIRFVRAQEVLELFYTSKSGQTHLTWRRTKNGEGRLTGRASLNSLVNLVTSKILEDAKTHPSSNSSTQLRR